jgi:hypothetical protein
MPSLNPLCLNLTGQQWTIHSSNAVRFKNFFLAEAQRTQRSSLNNRSTSDTTKTKNPNETVGINVFHSKKN